MNFTFPNAPVFKPISVDSDSPHSMADIFAAIFGGVLSPQTASSLVPCGPDCTCFEQDAAVDDGDDDIETSLGEMADAIAAGIAADRKDQAKRIALADLSTILAATAEANKAVAEAALLFAQMVDETIVSPEA
jgi:hypothetical protein